jgi:hypothetical protein
MKHKDLIKLHKESFRSLKGTSLFQDVVSCSEFKNSKYRKHTFEYEDKLVIIFKGTGRQYQSGSLSDSEEFCNLLYLDPEIMLKHSKPVILVGYFLGTALATKYAMDLVLNGTDVTEIITFGYPLSDVGIFNDKYHDTPNHKRIFRYVSGCESATEHSPSFKHTTLDKRSLRKSKVSCILNPFRWKSSILKVMHPIRKSLLT